jgi:transcriptional regulator with XRE-family HTH domain
MQFHITGRELRERRVTHGVSQRQVAARAGWAPSRVAAIEQTPRITPFVALNYIDAVMAVLMERIGFEP